MEWPWQNTGLVLEKGCEMQKRMRKRFRLTLTNGPKAATVLGIMLAFVLSACGTPERSPRTGDESFWSQFRLDARETEQYSSLADMKPKADAVVIGRFGKFTVGRAIQGDAPEDVVTFLTTDFAISETIAGKEYGGSVPIEFLGPANPDNVQAEVDRLNSSLPDSAVVVFLRDKGGAEEGLFRPVNSAGLWAETSRSDVDAPMMFEPPSQSDLYAEELQGIGSMDEFIQLVRNL